MESVMPVTAAPLSRAARSASAPQPEPISNRLIPGSMAKDCRIACNLASCASSSVAVLSLKSALEYTSSPSQPFLEEGVAEIIVLRDVSAATAAAVLPQQMPEPIHNAVPEQAAAGPLKCGAVADEEAEQTKQIRALHISGNVGVGEAERSTAERFGQLRDSS